MTSMFGFSACYISFIIGNHLIFPIRTNHKDFVGELRKRRGERERSEGILRLRARGGKKMGERCDGLNRTGRVV